MPSVPKVSIGMPVYNGEKFICDALDSILSQTFTDFELIISDNASEDRTELICREYLKSDARIQYIRQARNIGPAGNFKFVLDKAIGEFFMWAAADDQWSPNWLSHLLNNIKNTDFGVFGEYQYTDASGQAAGPPLIPVNLRKNSQLNTFMRRCTSGKCFYMYGLFLREKIAAVPLFTEVSFPGIDQIYILQFLAKGDLRSIPGSVFRYRIHDSNTYIQQSRDSGIYRQRLLSAFPARYYMHAIKAMPSNKRALAVVLVPVKYFYEQVHSYIDLLRFMVNNLKMALRKI